MQLKRLFYQQPRDATNVYAEGLSLFALAQQEGEAIMRWMSVMLTRDDIRAGKHIRLQNDFEKALLKTAAPKAAAMFVNDLSYYESGYYFSPGAVEIFAATLETFNARECGTPPRTGTSLLIGYSDAWDMLSTDAKSDGL